MISSSTTSMTGGVGGSGGGGGTGGGTVYGVQVPQLSQLANTALVIAVEVSTDQRPRTGGFCTLSRFLNIL